MTEPTTTAPYGSWPSPISIDDVLAGGVHLSDVRAAGRTLGWLQTVPSEDGRVTVQVQHDDGRVTELTAAPINVRCRVMEYGGGAWHLTRDTGQRLVVVACDDTSHRLLAITDAGTRPFTPESEQVRFGALQAHPDLDLVLAVREDHRGKGEPVTTLVALQLSGDNPDFGTVLAQGADFYADPELSDDGRLAWFEWDHPHMPWDASRVMTGRLVGDVHAWSLGGVRQVHGGNGVSAIHPRWQPRTADGRPGHLIFASDDNDFWNLYRWDGVAVAAVHTLAADVDTPPWVLGMRSWALVPDDQAAISWLDDGIAHLGLLDLGKGSVSPIEAPALAGVDSIAVSDTGVVASCDFTDRPGEVVTVTVDGIRRLVPNPSPAPDPGAVSIAEPLTVTEGRFGPVHAWYYPPTLTGVRAPEGQLPPLIVKSHGGPTAFASSAYQVATQFWTSRGFAVLDVNYSGSSGFGRAYRERLRRTWGIADVADCEAAAADCIRLHLADPQRIAITGGSAGGYTTLQSLVTSKVYTAGVSSYGIGDLMALATDTHKFESRYLDGLIGELPADEDVYHERSPIEHVDGLSVPMLILQGLDDKVVPPNQAESMAAAVRDKGLPVALLTFEGEGHGFRKLSTRRDVLAAQLSFYSQLWGFTPHGEVPTLAIENLTAR